MGKLPSFQFYPADWLKDPNLRRCSHTAKGVWIDLLCLAFEGSERGVLVTDGVAWDLEEIAGAIGGNLDVTLVGLQELVKKGVLKRRDDGAYYSKRMVEDEAARSYERNKKARQREGAGAGRPGVVPVDVPDLSPACPENVPPMSRHSSSSSSGREEDTLTPSAREPAVAPVARKVTPEHRTPPPADEEVVVRAGSMHGIPPEQCRIYYSMRAKDDWHTKFETRADGITYIPIRNWVQDLQHQFRQGNLNPKTKPTTRNGSPDQTAFERAAAAATASAGF